MFAVILTHDDDRQVWEDLTTAQAEDIIDWLEQQGELPNVTLELEEQP